jgi:ATP-dependent Clp protease ATP-binding subunit ClpC
VVQVAAREPRPEAAREAEEAQAALAAVGTSATVVRKYRWDPAPLVRDSVRGYRTGRIDRVMAGDFDLFG